MMRIPRLVVAGTHSGVGKTSVATALMAALCRRGLKVQPFKVGPDFIDPGFHSIATGRLSRNLDGWMLSREANLSIFERACDGADLAILEGVMGLFDGRDGSSETGSTAEMAKWLAAPVALVVDASAVARSAAAIVRGFEVLDPQLPIAGAILNRVSSATHYEYLRDAITASCNCRPLGYLEHNESIALPERHLGLRMAGEVLTAKKLDAMVGWIEKTLDIGLLLEIAAGAAGLPETPMRRDSMPAAPQRSSTRPRIGVARDAAFCFYYTDNLELLESFGAEIVTFSPLGGPSLPESLDGLYLGGGYPELHARALSRNTRLKESIRRFARSGAPVYAECGGFMYLMEAIVDADGNEHAMTGVFPTRARMCAQLAAIGYREVEVAGDAAWLRAGDRVRGHEFRYSKMDPMPDSIARRYRVRNGPESGTEGFCESGVVGSYVHLHFHSCPSFAERFVSACAANRR